MKKKATYLFLLTVTVLVFIAGCNSSTELYKPIGIGYVPSNFPVNFALYTTESEQYIAYYDSTHAITIAVRKLNSKTWEYKKLDSKVGWDSHNYLSLMIDSLGYIHLVGNMHSSPLIYFKSLKPNNISSMNAIHSMLGIEEDVTTYPEFFIDNDGKVIFHYRYGRSGNGYEVYNYLDVKNQKWKRLIDKPLVDGEGKMNAYITGPLLGSDNFYHMIWVWRDTWDCSTNHTLSYARSKDLINWESIQGEKVGLPLTIDQPQLYVDTTPPQGGLINIGIQIGFDSNKKPIIAYHKYDKEGNTQLFLTRFEGNSWKSKMLTDWDYRWDFKGMGTIKNELLIDAPFIENEAGIIFGYHHTKYGHGQLVINENDFSVLKTRDYKTTYPQEIDSVRSDNSEMIVNKVFDKGIYRGEHKYLLRWETLPPNRDAQIEKAAQIPSLLELIEY